MDVVIGTSPQFSTVCAAFITGTLKRVPWIFELRDIWPESIRAVGAIQQSVVLDFLEKVEVFLYRRASRIVSVTHAFRDTLMRRGIDGDRFRFVLLGDGANKAARARAEGLDNVVFVDSVPKDEVVRYRSLLDVSIIHVEKTDLFTSVIPSELSECMGMPIPVLHGVQGEPAGIVEREDVGVVFEPENTADLIAGLRRLADDTELYRRLKENGPRATRHLVLVEHRRADFAQRLAIGQQLPDARLS